MRIVDSYGINDGGLIFSVEIAEDRFVDVKVCKGNPEGLVYVVQNEDVSTVYTGEWVADGTCPGLEYDEKAVVDLVKQAVWEGKKEFPDVNNVLENARARSVGVSVPYCDKENCFEKV